MATITPTQIALGANTDALGINIYTWSNMTFSGSDVGAPVGLMTSAERSVNVEGTPSVGGTVVIEGSLDGTNYRTIKSPAGTALSFTAQGIEQVGPLVRFIRPKVTAGDGSTSFTINLMFKQSIL